MLRQLPLIQIKHASFRQTTSPSAAILFPGLSFTLPSPSAAGPTQKWSILGPSKYTFLSILSGTHVVSPPEGRKYPALAAHKKWPQGAIGLVSFGAGSKQTGMLAGGTDGEGYLSSRYESLRQEFDLSLRQWLEDSVDLGRNPWEDGGEQLSRSAKEEESERARRTLVDAVAADLDLGILLGQSVMTLSNGQSRRARIAQALLRKPEVLLVDEPFST